MNSFDTLFDSTTCRRFCALAIWLSVAGVAGFVEAEHFDGFESKQSSWRLIDADNRASVLERKRVTNEKHGGFGCEHLRITAGEGSFAYIGHNVPPATVIAELSPSIWLKSNRPGIQLMARVTLPRTTSRTTGKPMTTLLYGPLYTDTGYWQKLSFQDLYAAFERQIRIIRSQTTEPIDPREAFIDMIVINAYGGVGETELWIDDLEIKGHVSPDRASESFPEVVAEPAESLTQTDEFTFRGGKILINGRPAFIRAIEHNGESLAHLKELGFSAVILSQPADEKLRDDAARNNLWLISPPPVDVVGASIDSRYDRVIGWTLGNYLNSRDVALCRLRAEELRRHDLKHRPMLCGVESNLWNFSRLIDIAVVSRGGAFTSCSGAQSIDWLRQRKQLSRPGGSVWAAISTQCPEPMVQQLQTIFPRESNGPLPEMSQLRLAAYQAIAGGAQGLTFRSRSSLQNGSPAARQRSNMLRRLNIELAQIEPWAAGGEGMTDLHASAPEIRIASLRLERSRLLMIFHNAPDQQYASASTDGQFITFVDETAPTSARAWLLQPANLEPLKTGRRPGGLEITLAPNREVTLVVVTEHASTLRELTNRLTANARLTAQLEYTITQTELTNAADTIGKLQGHGQSLPQATQQLGSVRASAQQAERFMLGGDYRASVFYSMKAMQQLHTVRRTHWERASLAFPSPTASPLSCSFSTLPRHYELGNLLKDGKWGVNHLAGGTLEDLEHLTRTGWKNHRHSDSELNTVVQIDPAAARSGGGGLRLKAWPKQGQPTPKSIESPPVWITSSPTPMKAGTLVRIHGWAQLAEPVRGSSDGLVIFDSVAGMDLGHRLTETGKWKEFTLYRAVENDTEVVVTFALSGVGEAWLDDVSITPVSLPLTFPEASRPISNR